MKISSQNLHRDVFSINLATTNCPIPSVAPATKTKSVSLVGDRFNYS